LPNTIDRVLWGATSAGYISAGLPNIVGQYNMSGAEGSHFYASASGAIINIGGAGNVWRAYPGSASSSGFNFDASHSNTIYGASNTVQPPALKCFMCIKY
jgi:hypothetical protein